MKKLIRHKHTKAFLTSDGEWTNKTRLAHHFPNDEAICLARETHQLHSSGQVYLLFGEEPSHAFDFVFSISGYTLLVSNLFSELERRATRLLRRMTPDSERPARNHG
jgi:hypothetical protein